MAGFRVGIIKLSELEIDCDKVWQNYGITNIGKLTQTIAHGALIHRGASVLENLPAGTSGEHLTSQGSNKPPFWH